MITIAARSEATTDDRMKQAFFIVEPNREQLTRIGTLLETGRLQTFVDAIAARSSVRRLRGRSEGGETTGGRKLVIAVAA